VHAVASRRCKTFANHTSFGRACSLTRAALPQKQSSSTVRAVLIRDMAPLSRRMSCDVIRSKLPSVSNTHLLAEVRSSSLSLLPVSTSWCSDPSPVAGLACSLASFGARVGCPPSRSSAPNFARISGGSLPIARTILEHFTGCQAEVCYNPCPRFQ
jgi:hypothetical protein